MALRHTAFPTTENLSKTSFDVLNGTAFKGQGQQPYDNYMVKYSFLQLLSSFARVELPVHVCLYLLCLHLFSQTGLSLFTVKEIPGL